MTENRKMFNIHETTSKGQDLTNVKDTDQKRRTIIEVYKEIHRISILNCMLILFNSTINYLMLSNNCMIIRATGYASLTAHSDTVNNRLVMINKQSKRILYWLRKEFGMK